MKLHKHLAIKSRANFLKKFDDAVAQLYRGTAIDKFDETIPSPLDWRTGCDMKKRQRQVTEWLSRRIGQWGVVKYTLRSTVQFDHETHLLEITVTTNDLSKPYQLQSDRTLPNFTAVSYPKAQHLTATTGAAV